MGWGSNSSSKEGQVKSNQFVNSFVASSSSSSLCRYRAALVSSTSKPQQLSATPFLLLSFKMPLFRVVKEKKESMKTLEVRVSFHFFPRKFCSFFRFLLFEKHKKNPTSFGGEDASAKGWTRDLLALTHTRTKEESRTWVGANGSHSERRHHPTPSLFDKTGARFF